MTAPININFEMPENYIEYSLLPFQELLFASLDFSKCTLERDNTTLIFAIAGEKKIVLHNFFLAEHMGFFPTFVFPTGENISGFGFLTLLNSKILQENTIIKAGEYGSPAGSIIDLIHTKYAYEETLLWGIADELYYAPQKTIEDSVKMHVVEEEAPEFYASLEEYRNSVQNLDTEKIKDTEKNKEIENILDTEDIENTSFYETPFEEESSEYSISEEESPVNYYTGAVLNDTALSEGYAIVSINGDTALMEQMAPGEYGYVTMRADGVFTYILGEGVYPPEDSYLEEYFIYTIVTPMQEYVEGNLTLQSFYQNGHIAYQDYHTEL